jgi:hypothetical protein
MGHSLSVDIIQDCFNGLAALVLVLVLLAAQATCTDAGPTLHTMLVMMAGAGAILRDRASRLRHAVCGLIAKDVNRRR